MQTPLSSSLELIVISAEGLHFGGCWPKNNNIFATVDFGLYNHAATDTTTDTETIWNQKLHLQWRSDVQHIRIEVKRRSMLGNVTRGVADIPVSDFRRSRSDVDYVPPNYLHFLSYPLRDRRDRRCGIVNLSFRLIQPN